MEGRVKVVDREMAAAKPIGPREGHRAQWDGPRRSGGLSSARSGKTDSARGHGARNEAPKVILNCHK